jgi:hypothetical protein
MKISSKSDKLIDYFSNNIFNIIKLTHKTKQIFKILFKDISNAFIFIQKLKKSPYLYEVKEIERPNDIIMPTTFNSDSFPENIINHIKLNSECQIKFTFEILERNIVIYFVLEEKNIDFKKIFEYVDLILMWLFIADEYCSLKCAKQLTIYIYLTSLFKILPISNFEILNENHVNTAFTRSCSINSEIVIFRKEEWFKVFLHETFHNFGLDFSGMNNISCNDEILSIFKVNSEVNLFEPYAEFWAQIMNSCFCSFLYLNDKTNENGFLTNVEILLNNEIQFGIFQLVKVLNFMGMRYGDLYSDKESSIQLRNNFYKENTNILSYFVIKSVLMNNSQGFLDWCYKNNLSLLNFKKTNKNIIKFCDFIKKNYKTKSMCNNIKNTEIFFDEEKKKSNNFIFSNLKMSVYEFK